MRNLLDPRSDINAKKALGTPTTMAKNARIIPKITGALHWEVSAPEAMIDVGNVSNNPFVAAERRV
jgi:hypothetical protein